MENKRSSTTQKGKGNVEEEIDNGGASPIAEETISPKSKRGRKKKTVTREEIEAVLRLRF